MDVSIETRKADTGVVIIDVTGRLCAGEAGLLFRGVFHGGCGRERKVPGQS